MQQYVHRFETATKLPDAGVANAPRRTLSRLERTLVLTLLWLLSASIFVGAAVCFAAALQQAGLDAKYAELLLGLSYFPLYLIVRKGWMTARHKLLATELDAFLKAHDIKV